MRHDSAVFADPRANLDYDDQLLAKAEAGQGEVLRLWESSSYFVVLGRTCREDLDVNFDAVNLDGIPVLRRSSGGGTVLQGPGCLNFSVVLAKQRSRELETIAGSYLYILNRVIEGLAGIKVEAQFRPVCDLVLGGTDKKFSGNAQRRGRHYILHHGTILYSFDLSLIARYLKHPPKMPDYRQSRPHLEFVTNINASGAEIRQALNSAF